MKETSGCFKTEISSEFAIALLLVQLEARAILTLLGFIDFQRAPAYFVAVEFLDRRRAFFLGLHFDKAEAA